VGFASTIFDRLSTGGGTGKLSFCELTGKNIQRAAALQTSFTIMESGFIRLPLKNHAMAYSFLF
jgi:hypothetical protein